MLFSGFFSLFAAIFWQEALRRSQGVEAIVLFHAADDELQIAAGVEHCNLHLHARCCV